ncbi:MAG TPA: hypothetical protein VEA35_11910 [Ramlibacter sp.]|nr:hypothetical protein [Ramlibacter sp.]
MASTRGATLACHHHQAESTMMKTPWTSTLAWLAAVVAAVLMAWAAPDEGSILRQSGQARFAR